MSSAATDQAELARVTAEATAQQQELEDQDRAADEAFVRMRGEIAQLLHEAREGRRVAARGYDLRLPRIKRDLESALRLHAFGGDVSVAALRRQGADVVRTISEAWDDATRELDALAAEPATRHECEAQFWRCSRAGINLARAPRIQNWLGLRDWAEELRTRLHAIPGVDPSCRTTRPTPPAPPPPTPPPPVPKLPGPHGPHWPPIPPTLAPGAPISATDVSVRIGEHEFALPAATADAAAHPRLLLRGCAPLRPRHARRQRRR